MPARPVLAIHGRLLAAAGPGVRYHPTDTRKAAMKYRKKPVVIDAWEIATASEQPTWVADAFAAEQIGFDPNEGALWVRTLEGTMTGAEGDMLIRGVKGELYPCRADIFAATYEPAEG